jgi:hypothetical protein
LVHDRLLPFALNVAPSTLENEIRRGKDMEVLVLERAKHGRDESSVCYLSRGRKLKLR